MDPDEKKQPTEETYILFLTSLRYKPQEGNGNPAHPLMEGLENKRNK